MSTRRLNASALLPAAVMGLGGLAFSLGNLLLARALPTAGYAQVSLSLGIAAVAGLAAPLGLDLVIARRALAPDRRWLRAMATGCALCGTLAGLGASAAYGEPAALGLATALLVLASGLLQGSSAIDQGQRRFGRAVWLAQLVNFSVLIAGACAAIPALAGALGSLGVMAGVALAAALIAWSRRRAGEGGSTVGVLPRAAAKEAVALLALTVSSSILLQLERLVLGPLVNAHDLALFGVLAALVGSPYRMLQAAVQFTLVPVLRASPDAAARRRALRREVLQVGAVSLACAGGIALCAPPLAHYLLAGRYELSGPLLIAGLVSGLLKVACGFTLAVVVALAPDAHLRGVGGASWLAIGLAAAGAVLGARWGLIGVLYGISAGWLARTVFAGVIAAPLLRTAPDSAPLRAATT